MPQTRLSRREALNALRGPVRLRTLSALRWLAVGGQTAAVFFVHFALGFETPLGACLAVIAASAWLNIFTMLRYSPQRYLSDWEAAASIAFDIVQLCLMLLFTGGLQNPFSALFIAPVTIAASVLPWRITTMITLLAISGISLLAIYHFPLPWRIGEEIRLPGIYIAGIWAALTFSVAFFAAYAHRIAADSAQLRSALAATQLVLAREERLAALGGLAAAAAHELGTPLATIQVTAREMQHELEDNEMLHDDAALLVSQAKRCRDILGRLSRRGEAGDAMHDRLSIDALMKEAAEPFMENPNGPQILLMCAPPETDDETLIDPILKRQPPIVFGLRNFVENAAGYATDLVFIHAAWDENELTISVHDDGPGFSQEILTRLGEPYIGSGRSSNPLGRKKGGLGLGFFIAKTLIEGTGAEVSFSNEAWGRDDEHFGAVVRATWPIDQLITSPIS